jgi:hypothetical protein
MPVPVGDGGCALSVESGRIIYDGLTGTTVGIGKSPGWKRRISALGRFENPADGGEADPRFSLPGLYPGRAPETGRTIIFWNEPHMLLSSEIDVLFEASFRHSQAEPALRR